MPRKKRYLQQQLPGLVLTLRAYQVYIAAVAMFVAQLEPLPGDWRQIERKAVRSMLRGPFDWVWPSTLRDLRSVGGVLELRDVHAASIAARARVAKFEDGGRLRVASRARRLRAMVPSPELSLQAGAVWEALRAGSVVYSLQEATRLVGEAMPAGVPRPRRGEYQAKATQWLRRGACVMAKRQLESQLRRTPLYALPGRRLRPAVAALVWVGRHCQPRVHSALLRSYLAGWSTEARFGRRGPCRFCDRYQDSLAHIARCPVGAGWLRGMTGTAPAAPPQALDCLLMLGGGPPTVQRAVGLYAIYEVHNAIRVGRVQRWHARAALAQAARAATGRELDQV